MFKEEDVVAPWRRESTLFEGKSSVKMRTVLRAFVGLGGLGLLFSPMAAQAASGVSSTVANISLSYSSPETLTVVATPVSGTVTLPSGGGTAPSPIPLNTQSTLVPGRVLTIEAGFSGPTALTNGTGQSIPASAVSATFTSSVGKVTSMPNCMSASSGATTIASGFSCGWITYPASTASTTNMIQNDSFTVSLNPLGAAPGAYTGALLISAQAN
jgi:Rieske Fe-S protein